MKTPLSILLADDDESDIMLLQRAFKQAAIDNPVEIVRDGEEAIGFLSAPRLQPNDRMPALVILDVKMPRRTGMEVLEWMRAQPALSCLPVVIFSSSEHPADVERAYSLGANAYLVKPPSTYECAEVARFIKDWLKFNQPPMASSEGLQLARQAHATGSFRRAENGVAPPHAS